MTRTGLAISVAPATRRRIMSALIVVIIALTLIRPYIILTSTTNGPFSDFDIFHASANAILAGDAESIYNNKWLRAFEVKHYGIDFQGAWTYPPPYDLVIAPFGLVSRGWGLLLFVQLSLLAYLLAIRRLARPWLEVVYLLLLPIIMMTIFFGQNGHLTGALIGMTCVGMLEKRRWAGVPLGLMIIKPHLAIGFAIYVVASRDWRTFWTAAAVVAAATALSTLVLGPGIWPAFAAAAGFAGQQIASNFFPLDRMVSAFAAARTLGASPGVSWLAQLVSTVSAIAIIVVAQRRLPLRQSLGITAFASLLISPYAFDYDLPVAGIGLALLLPDLARLGRPVELVGLYALFLAATGIVSAAVSRNGLGTMPSIAVYALFAVLAWTWAILRRDDQAEATPRLTAALPQ